MTVGLQAINARSACSELRAKVQADYISVHPDQLEIPEHRLREIKPETIRELADSIKEVGLLQPIGVKLKAACTGRYVVIYGARRTLAMQLLRREALEQAADPNTDQEAFRYSQVHALKFRKEIDDEVCRELEIRENLDRKELTFNQRKAHLLMLGAMVQRRLKKRGTTYKEPLIVGNGSQPSKDKTLLITNITNNVAHEVAKSIGISVSTLQKRVASAARDVGKPLSLDHTPAKELDIAADQIANKQPAKRHGKLAVPSLGKPTKKGVELTAAVYPANAAQFAEWMRKRHPASFSLDDIRAYRDALIELVKHLEQQSSTPSAPAGK